MENINSEISDCHVINIYEIPPPPIHAINVKVVCKSEREREREMGLEMNIERNTIIHDRCISNIILSGLNTGNTINRVHLREGLIVNLDSISDLKYRLIVGGFLLGIMMLILYVTTRFN